MCGRFIQIGPPARYADLFGAPPALEGLAPRYNLAPSQDLLAVRARDDGRALVPLRWGLVPHWSQGPDGRFSMINARAETVHEKPAYRGPFRTRRCLVPAEGFYEWRTLAGGKQPYLIRLRSGAPFALAGLWDDWRAPDGTLLETCALIVTDANEVVAPIHERMPVILPPEAWARWLDPRAHKPADLLGWLRPYPAAEMEAFPVSRRVNSPRQEGPDLLERHPDLDSLR